MKTANVNLPDRIVAARAEAVAIFVEEAEAIANLSVDQVIEMLAPRD